MDEHGQLDTLYCSAQPLERRQQNIPHILHHHLNHPSNAPIIAPLLAAATAIGPSAARMLRLLCASLFQGHLYMQRRRLARGAYAQVSKPPCPSFCASQSCTLDPSNAFFILYARLALVPIESSFILA